MTETPNKVGAPTKYNEQILIDSQMYLDQFLGDAYLELIGKDFQEEVIPSIEGLSDHIKIARSTIYEWRDHPDRGKFSDILDRILARQAKLLLNQGLSGKFNANIAKLALGKHGYSDKSETDVTTNGSSIGMNETERLAKIEALIAKGKANSSE